MNAGTWPVVLTAIVAAGALHAGVERSGNGPSRALVLVQANAERTAAQRRPLLRQTANWLGIGLRRRRHRIRAELAELLDLVARALRSGRSLHQALEDVVDSVDGPLRDEFAEALRQTSQGLSLEAAVRAMAERIGDVEVSSSLQALLLAIESGGGPSRALDGIGQAARDRSALRDEITALIAQARTSMRVLAGMPVVFVGIGALVDPTSLAFFVVDPVGRVCLVAGIVLDAVGFAWMHRLLRGIA